MLTIAFSGDIRFSGCVKPESKTADFFAADIVATLQRCDYAVFNIEGPITDSPPQKKVGAIVQSHPTCVPIIEGLNCSVFSLANNHTFDHGLQGYRDTIEVARHRNWRCLGAGENLDQASSPLILRGDDVTLGLLAVCHEEGPVAGPDAFGIFCHNEGDLIQNRLDSLREQCDFVGVIYHGGEEIHHLPWQPRRERLLGYLNSGADFVVAHHAHVVQGYERVGAKYVFYGLGDFSFDFTFGRKDPGVDDSVLLVIRMEKDKPLEFEPIFTHEDRAADFVQTKIANPWFREIQAASFDADYKEYACAVLKQWLNGDDISTSSITQRLKRTARVLWRLRDRYQRHLILKGMTQMTKEFLGKSRR